MTIVAVDSINCVGSRLTKNPLILSGRSPSPDKTKDLYYLFMIYFSKSVRLRRMVGKGEVVLMLHYVSSYKHEFLLCKKLHARFETVKKVIIKRFNANWLSMRVTL